MFDRSLTSASIRTQILLYGSILGLTLYAGYALEKSNYSRYISELRGLLREKAAVLSTEIERELIAREVLVSGIAGVLESFPNITQSEFSDIAAHYSEGHSEVVNIAAAPDLKVTLVHPIEQNRAVLGLDYRTIPSQLPDVLRARDTRSSVISGVVNLVQGGTGFIVRAPVFTMDENQDHARFWGIVSVVIDQTRLLDETGFFDVDSALVASLQELDEQGVPRSMIAGDPAIFDQSPVLHPVLSELSKWQIGIRPASGWPAYSPDRLNIWLIVAAFGAIAMIVARSLREFGLQREEARLNLVEAIEAIDDGFALYGPDDKLILCNQKYKNYYSKSADLFEPGTPFETIIREGVARGQYPEAEGQEEEWIAARMHSHRNPKNPGEQLLDDGRWLKIAEAKTLNGSIVGFRVDVTELKNAKEAAERSDRSKSDFLNNISHELRTPLTAIIGYAKFLVQAKALPEYRTTFESLVAKDGCKGETTALFDEFLDRVVGFSSRIDASAEHLLYLINDILDWSKIEANELSLNRTSVSVDDLVNSVLRKLYPVAHEKNLSITAEIQGEKVFGDKIRLEQVLINLVGNAIKFTSEGGVAVKVSQEGKFVSILVEDTGIGIEKDNFELVFERFKQVDNSTTRSYGGTGLGLAIAKHIVLLHGGQVDLTSEMGKGSKFRVLLPAADPTLSTE